MERIYLFHRQQPFAAQSVHSCRQLVGVRAPSEYLVVLSRFESVTRLLNIYPKYNIAFWNESDLASLAPSAPLNRTVEYWLTSNLVMKSEKMPKKVSVLVDLLSSPKKEATLENSSMALVCKDSRDWIAGWLFSRKLCGCKCSNIKGGLHFVLTH